MLIDYVVGLLSSLHFVGCGVQLCCGLLWIPSESFSINNDVPVLWIVNAAIIHCVFVAAEVPWFRLQLSCFGHARAKNDSELPCGLELCLTFRLGLSPVAFASSQGCEGIVLLQYVVVGLRTVLAWPIVEGLVNPAVLVRLIVSLGYV